LLHESKTRERYNGDGEWKEMSRYNLYRIEHNGLWVQVGSGSGLILWPGGKFSGEAEEREQEEH